MPRRVKHKDDQKETEQQVKKREKRVKETTGLPEEQMDRLGLNWLRATTVFAIFGVLLFLGVFFTSDIRDRIIQIHQQEKAYAAPLDKSSERADTFHIAIVGDTNVGKKEITAYLKSLSDADFKKFKKVLLEKLEATDLQKIESAKALRQALKDGTIHRKAELIDYLAEMEPSELNALLKKWSKSSETARVDKGLLKQTLKDAYTEAERLYPGKIDGSKRLKLIADLNATGYLYYVAEQGDTLITLSEAFSVPLGQLVELNGIHDADVIAAGEILLFPKDTKQPPLQKKK